MTHTNYMLNATASLYTHDMIMIFYTVVRQKLRFQHTKIVNSTVSPSCHFGMRNQCLAAGWQTWSATVGNVKISVSECPSYCCIRMQFGCLFYSLSLANCVSVMTKLLRLYISSPYLALVNEHVDFVMLYRALPQALHIVGTMSAFRYIDNLA